MDWFRVNFKRFRKSKKKYYTKKHMLIIIDTILVVFLLNAIILSVMVFLIPMSEEVSASTLYVGGLSSGNYSSIQDAIDAAKPGDTVYVYNKTYYEFILINKSINLIGEKILNWRPIIDGLLTPYVVYVDNVNYFNMSGFEVRNGSTGWGHSGIYMNSSSNITISDNIIYDTCFGISIVTSSFINIQGNEIYNNTANGIECHYSSNNKFINNTVHDNPGTGGIGGTGIFFSGTPYYNNTVIGNIVYNNKQGINLEDQTSGDILTFWNNRLINNIVYNHTSNGIFIGQGINNYIIDNIVHHNGLGSINPQGGIRISSSNDNTVIGNTVYDNEHGIMLEQSFLNQPPMNNAINENTVYNNDNGIKISRAEDNTFFENTIFNNKNSVYIERQSRNNSFINCSLSNPTYYDFNLTDDSHAICLNTTFNKTRVYYGDNLSSGGHPSSLTVKWFMHVKVIYWNGSPVSYARIWVNDTLAVSILDRSADSEGWVKWIVVTEYIEQDIDGDHIGDRFYFTPHYATATDGNLWGYAYPNMDISKVVLIRLGTPPPLLPPTNLTTKVVNNGINVELEWDSITSLALDHYLIYRADSATEFDFTKPYNSSTTWPNPKNFTWIDPDPNITAVDDDFYYIVRAANFDESDISMTSNTAGVWTRTFESGISTFSLPLEPFVKKDTEFYCQDMNASYIKWMNQTTHTWMRHDKGSSENNTMVEVGKGYEIGFLSKSIQTKYTFTGMPGAMILYDNISFGFDATPLMGDADSLTAKVDNNGNVTLNWTKPTNIGSGDQYYILRSNLRDGFWGTLGVNYTQLAVLPFNILSYQDIGNATPGTEYYYMIVPVNLSTSERGVSSYSIGVWTAGYLDQYDTFALPLRLSSPQTMDWYCDNIPNTVGINYYDIAAQRWCWHSTRMPAGAYDSLLVMTEGYQISTLNVTKFTFIGI